MVHQTQLPAVLLLVFVCVLLLCQLVAFCIFKWKGSKPGTLHGPWQIWIDRVLSRYPVLALLTGILFPAGFSVAGLYSSDFQVEVNLDFRSYLAAELEEQYHFDIVTSLAREQVDRSEGIQDRDQERWASWNFVSASEAENRLQSSEVDSRRLDLQPLQWNYWKLDIFYQAKDPEKGIFTREALEEIRDFEQRMRDFPGFADFCRKKLDATKCDPFYSATNIFFSVPNVTETNGAQMKVIYDGSGSLANINDVLQGFLRDGLDWFVDKDFGPQNPKSQYTRASFFGGRPLPGYPDLVTRSEEQEQKTSEFLKDLWLNLLHRTEISGKERLNYEHVIFSWHESRFIYDHEVRYYLINDCWLGAGTIILVTTLVLLRQQNVFTTLCGVLGVLLAFTSTYYFHYAVMGYQRLTVMDLISIFLIIAIAADNILLLYNTYELAPAVMPSTSQSPGEKMRWAYRKASLAMLVTSVTTCGSFYANMLSIVSVVRAFGFFMGTLVLWNFVNVLTIFAASILVSEIYLAPLLPRCRSKSAGQIVQPDFVSTDGTMQMPASAREFSKDPSSVFADAQIAQLGFVERFMDTKFRPCLVSCRWLLLVTSLCLGGIFVFLAYSSFKVASGDIILFESDLNLGRIKMLITEIFPSYASSDLNRDLEVVNPVWPTTVPSCPRLADNSSWCSGHGSCDTFTGRCSCQEDYVGNGCSVLRQNGSVELVNWPAPNEGGSYALVHCLSRPSLLESVASMDFTATVELVNRGDEMVEWSLFVPNEVSNWMGVVPTSGVVPKRSFGPNDQPINGRGAFVLRYFVGSRPAGFFETVDSILDVKGFGPQPVHFSVLVMRPPALASLDIEFLDDVDGNEVNVTASLEPPFSLDFGFSEDDMLNLALPGNAPMPTYSLSLPFEVSRIAVNTVLFGTASRVEVNGIPSNGVSEPIDLSVEPAMNEVSIEAFSAESDLVRVLYRLNVLRASTTSTTTTGTSTTTMTTLPSVVKGEISIQVSDCLLLSSDAAAQDDLVSGLAAVVGFPSSRIRIDVRCSRRMNGNGRTLQLASAVVVYELLIPGDGGLNGADVVATLEGVALASLTSTLQNALDSGSSGISLTVTAISAEVLVASSSTSTSSSRSTTSTEGSSTSSKTATETQTTATTVTGTDTTSETSTVTQTFSTGTSTTHSTTTRSSSETQPESTTDGQSQSTSATVSSASITSTVQPTMATSSTSTISRSITSTTYTQTSTYSTSGFSSSTFTSSLEETSTSTASFTSTISTTATQSSTVTTTTVTRSSTFTSTHWLLSTQTLPSTTSTVTSSTGSSTVSSTVTRTLESTSTVSAGTTETATSTVPDYIISGSISMEVSNCSSLESSSGQEGLRQGIAQAAGVETTDVSITVACDRRLGAITAKQSNGPVVRQLSVTATVDYLIDPEVASLDELMWFRNTAHSKLLAETPASLSQTLETALVSAGANVSINVLEIGYPVVSIKITSTTTTTAASCPGNPVCGGLVGQCIVENDSNESTLRCQCSETYAGEACDLRVCPMCENNGTCKSGAQDPTSKWTCACPEGYQGPHCELLRCPNDCANSGDCNTETGLCSCFPGYLGADCSETLNWKVPIANCIEIILTWGLNGHQAYNTSAPEYNSMFDLFAPETQAWLLETCQVARAETDLMVRDELQCWIEGFQIFVNSAGGIFPVDAGLASQALQAFMHREDAKPFYGDIVTDGDDYAGRASFARVRLKINVALNDNTTYRTAMRERWSNFVRRRNDAAPPSVGVMLMVSSTWMQMEMESKVVSSTLMAFLGSISVSLLAVAFFTQNVIIALYVCINICLVVCILAGFLLNVMGYEFGVAEAIGATIFVGLSVDYCLHLAHAYNRAPGSTSQQKMRHALVVIGPSILGGAVTTIAGTAFLLPCRILLFQKLGWSLFANAATSILLTFFFLCPMLIVLGPTGHQGDLCPCLRPSVSKAASDKDPTVAVVDVHEVDMVSEMGPEVTGRTSSGTFRLDVLTNNTDDESVALERGSSEGPPASAAPSQAHEPSLKTDGTFNVDDIDHDLKSRGVDLM